MRVSTLPLYSRASPSAYREYVQVTLPGKPPHLSLAHMASLLGAGPGSPSLEVPPTRELTPMERDEALVKGYRPDAVPQAFEERTFARLVSFPPPLYFVWVSTVWGDPPCGLGGTRLLGCAAPMVCTNTLGSVACCCLGVACGWAHRGRGWRCPVWLSVAVFVFLGTCHLSQSLWGVATTHTHPCHAPPAPCPSLIHVANTALFTVASVLSVMWAPNRVLCVSHAGRCRTTPHGCGSCFRT